MLIFTLGLPSWSDVKVHSNDSQSKKVCYCGCDHTNGTPMCMHMCDLPKYENRPWAKSCRKIQLHAHSKMQPNPDAHSGRHNDVEDARVH
jgi:hypothetical protein